MNLADWQKQNQNVFRGRHFPVLNCAQCVHCSVRAETSCG